MRGTQRAIQRGWTQKEKYQEFEVDNDAEVVGKIT